MGTPSKSPHSPQIQLQKSNPMNTDTEFMCDARPVSHVVRPMPISPEITSVLPATLIVMGNVPNCKKPARPLATAISKGPKYGITCNKRQRFPMRLPVPHPTP